MKILQRHNLRNDVEGLGHYHAPRGNRLHKGVDIVSVEFENVYAPIDGTIRNGIVSSTNTNRKLVEVRNGNKKVKLMYVEPLLNNGEIVRKGDVIGKAQDTSKLYHLPNMISHIHVEILIDDINVDPTQELFSKSKKKSKMLNIILGFVFSAIGWFITWKKLVVQRELNKRKSWFKFVVVFSAIIMLTPFLIEKIGLFIKKNF